MPDAKRVAILFNNQAGGVTSADLDALVLALNEHGFSHTAVFPIQSSEALFDAEEEFERIVVLGGDGTARAAAARADQNTPPMILLPGGTMNILPNALYGPGLWPDVLKRALEHGRCEPLVGGSANGEPFFVAAMFGGPTLLARAREEVRKGRFLTMISKTHDFLRRALMKKISSCPDIGHPRDVDAVAVICPAMFNIPDSADLEWIHLRANNFFDLARVGLSALGPDWRDDPAIDARRCNKGTLRSSGLVRMPAILDGEPASFASPVRIEPWARAPRVIRLPERTA